MGIDDEEPVTVLKKESSAGFSIPRESAYDYDMLDSENLKSKIIGHNMCFRFEETDFTFAVIFPDCKSDVKGLKVSRGLGDGKALEKLFEKMDQYERMKGIIQ